MDNLLVELKPFEVTYQLDGKVMSLIFKTKKEMALTMMRMAEHYESDYSEIKGKYFSHEQFLDVYSDADGTFDYLNFWSGFNVPKTSVTKFKELFKDITVREQRVLNEFEQSGAQYLIAYLDGDDTTIAHELCHAKFNVEREYNQKILKIIYSIPKDVYTLLQFDLLDLHYAIEVLDDEIAAYMLTSSEEELLEIFPSFKLEELVAVQKLFLEKLSVNS
jgi:hypothetical protein